MSSNLIRDVVLIGAVALGAFGYLQYKTTSAVEPETREAPPAQTEQAEVKPKKSGSVLSIPKNPRDGQFWADGRVNSGHVRFLVDTGASSVALTYMDAQKAGIKVRDLNYNVPINTAGGRNYAAYVRLDHVTLGAITIRDVDAMVVKDGLHVSLLGMTYLGQLQKVEATPNALLLRL